MYWRRTSALLIILVSLTSLAACSSKKTIATQQGTATVETNALHNTVKVTTGRGTAIIGRGAVDAKALGLPLYPDTIANQTGAMASNSSEGSKHVVSLMTHDPFDKVYQWYRAHMPAGSEQLHMDDPSGSIATFVIGKEGAPDVRSVQIQTNAGTTTILLSHLTKNG